jgi:hypothetical protein
MVATEPTERLAQLPPGWPAEIAGADVRVPTLDGTLLRYVNLDTPRVPHH